MKTFKLYPQEKLTHEQKQILFNKLKTGNNFLLIDVYRKYKMLRSQSAFANFPTIEK